MGLQVNRHPLGQVFEPTDARDQREHGFDEHPLPPRFVLTELEIARCFDHFLETKVTQHNGLLVELIGDGTKGLVMNVGGVPVPSHHFASVIDQPVQLNADDPAAVAFALLAHLLRTASFADRMNQFNPISIDDRERGRVRQQPLTPVSMRLQRPCNPRAIRQSYKQAFKVALQPTVEGTKAPL